MRLLDFGRAPLALFAIWVARGQAMGDLPGAGP